MSLPISKDTIEGKRKSLIMCSECKESGIKLENAENGMYRIVYWQCANVISKFEDRVTPPIIVEKAVKGLIQITQAGDRVTPIQRSG
jgi:hypothetical protein